MKYLKQATVETFSPPFSDVCSDKLNILCGPMLFIMDDKDMEKAMAPVNTKQATADNLIIQYG